MTTRILTVLGLLALSASYAEARPKFSAQVLYGLSGTTEASVGNVSTDDDVDSSLGFMGTVEWQLNRKSPFRLGLRVGYNTLTTQSDANNDTDYTALDGGVWARYILVPGRFVVYGAGSIGVSSLSADPQVGETAEGTGINFHIGGGASYPVAKGMRLTGGIYFSRHSGELEANNVTADVVAQQVQLAVGVAF